MKREFKAVAPDIDRLLNCFKDYMNSSGITKKLNAVMTPIFNALSDLAPLKTNREAKAIWVQIPRGKISDFGSYEEMKEYGEVKNHKQFERRWNERYPDELNWYRLVIVEEKNPDGIAFFKGVGFGNKTIISASLDKEREDHYDDEFAITLCELILDAAKKSMELLKKGEYNTFVQNNLPYWFRTGVIKRSALWAYEPETKKYNFDGLSEESVAAFRKLLASGINDKSKIGRINNFTANSFFNACAIGYKACGYDVEGKTPSELYLKYADGRDEGLTGTGLGLNAGPGIDFDNPYEWDSWYFGKRGGGHPWEVVPGGNSTHVSLFVRHDESELGYLYRSEKISESEYKERQKTAGYYFEIKGKHRAFEAVSFYLALCAAGLPVILDDAEEILARFDGSDYVGIVPRDTFPRYCEGMFPEEYGHVIDFIHVFDEEVKKYGKDIIWLPLDTANLIR